MSTTASQAFAAVKSRLASGISFILYYQGDDAPILPDTPATFGYVVFNNQGGGKWPIAVGGGSGANLYRNEALVEVFVFSPLSSAAAGTAFTTVMDAAETVATRLRSFRDSNIQCFGADVIPVGKGSDIAPPGLASAVNNYICAVVEANMHFDLIG